MDARQVPLEMKDQATKRSPIKRKNSAEEKVKLIESKEKEALADEKLELDVPRKGSKEKVLSPRFFVRSASGEKKEQDPKESAGNGKNYNKI